MRERGQEVGKKGQAEQGGVRQGGRMRCTAGKSKHVISPLLFRQAQPPLSTAMSDLALVVRVVQLARQADHHLPGGWALGGYARRLAVAAVHVRYAAEDAVYRCAAGGATWKEVWERYGGMCHTRHMSRSTLRARGWVTTMGAIQWIGVKRSVP